MNLLADEWAYLVAGVVLTLAVVCFVHAGRLAFAR